MQFHSREKARLRRGVALFLLTASVAGCSGNVDRFGQSEYVDEPTPAAQTAVVVTPGLPPASSRSSVQRGVILPPSGGNNSAIVTGSVQPQAYTRQIWQPKFSAEQPAAPSKRVRASRLVPAALAKAPNGSPLGWTAVGGQVVTLKSNENVESLSWHYRVPVNEILHANRVTVDSALQPGDSVVIPVQVVRQAVRSPKAGERVMPHQLTAARSQPLTTASIPTRYVSPLNTNAQSNASQNSRNEFATRIAVALVPPGNVGERSRPVYSDAPPPAYPVQPGAPAPAVPSTTLAPMRSAPGQVYGSPEPTTTYRSQSLSPIVAPRPASAQPAYGVPATGQAAINMAPVHVVTTPKSKPQVPQALRPVAVAKTTATDKVPKPKNIALASLRQQPTSAPVAPQITLANSLTPTPVHTASVQRPQIPIAPVIPEPDMDVDVVRLQPSEVSKPAPVQPAKQTKAPKAVTEEATTFRWPVRGRIISDFGVKPGGSRNDGINLAVPSGTGIKAAEDGTIVYAGNELKGFGNLVLIRHDNGWVSAYAHNKELKVRRGDVVRRGQTIAMAGATGSVTQPQLHFELRKANKPVDPMNYLPRS
ncbi:Murein hydrolase activator NlpD precursor [Pseudovibrio axinellae]|uniref:Murein hydrolase activator NlpD n=1 Tax=Pseudovibrio axinellae TaxID=989403 RepID=A0A165YQK1_9HYPH|nr:M23 family metallopeptidase [Pseudovibrio axinellae]KZL19128.1 Murein hydrolase activator NlpD precursor [Pseudovibrio axinellae]SER34183.1 Murein DD-endopeptidase MepM and murein hydrolase activator NlpD, contain LysM domain [Pseudovibrio axinellae]